MSRHGLSHDGVATHGALPPGEADERQPGQERCRQRSHGHPTVGREERIAAVLLEIAALSRRLGRRAADLTRLAAATGQPSDRDTLSAARGLAAAAAEVAAGAADVRRPGTPAHRGPRRGPQRATNGGRRPGRLPRADGAVPRSTAARAARRSSLACGPLVASAAAHAVAILVLSLIFLRGPTPRTPLALDFGTTEPPVGGALTPVELAPAEPLPGAADSAADFQDDVVVEPSPPEIAAELPVDAIPVDALAVDAPAVALVDLGSVGTGDAIGDGPAADGGAGGLGADRRDPAAALRPGRSTTTFFGRSGAGQSVCFLCDNSNSHDDGGFHMVLEEIARAIDGLRPDQSFFVVFFSDAAYPLFHPNPAQALAPATPDNKRRLRAWLHTVEMCRGGQGIHDAVRIAGSLEPDVVYLLSDGQMAGSVVDRVVAADFGAATVHTLGMQQSVVDRRTGMIDADRAREQDGCNRNLVTIATAHGGQFTPVIVPPAAATLERLRPIIRNRARGPVWGLRL